VIKTGIYGLNPVATYGEVEVHQVDGKKIELHVNALGGQPMKKECANLPQRCLRHQCFLHSTLSTDVGTAASLTCSPPLARRSQPGRGAFDRGAER